MKLFIIVISTFTLIGITAPTENPCDLAMLRRDAPEVLRMPIIEEFTGNAYYYQAMNRFERNGNWATLQDGTECRPEPRQDQLLNI